LQVTFDSRVTTDTLQSSEYWRNFLNKIFFFNNVANQMAGTSDKLTYLVLIPLWSEILIL
jgi:hypothetical protein